MWLPCQSDRVRAENRGIDQFDKGEVYARQYLQYHALSSGEARTFTPRWEGIYMMNEQLHLIPIYFYMPCS